MCPDVTCLAIMPAGWTARLIAMAFRSGSHGDESPCGGSIANARTGRKSAGCQGLEPFANQRLFRSKECGAGHHVIRPRTVSVVARSVGRRPSRFFCAWTKQRRTSAGFLDTARLQGCLHIQGAPGFVALEAAKFAGQRVHLDLHPAGSKTTGHTRLVPRAVERRTTILHSRYSRCLSDWDEKHAKVCAYQKHTCVCIYIYILYISK